MPVGTPAPPDPISSTNELSGAPKLEPELGVKRMGLVLARFQAGFMTLGEPLSSWD